ncbi:MAG TPA: serine/threonine-protein kinase [Ktedonobacterales bacterium]|nr:serine/threonine-protein kinase [Ktedonobacterales bacterium]
MSAETPNSAHEESETPKTTRSRAQPADPLIGQTAGRYHILGALGRGAASVVYLAERVTSDEPTTPEQTSEPTPRFALKALTIPADTPEEDCEALRLSFLRETQIAQRLKHPHILAVVDVGVIEGRPYLVMPYIAGPTLAKLLITRHGPLSLDDTITYVTQTASALDYAHERGIIHRDVKPSNLLLDGALANVYLTDFGIASLQDGGAQLLGPAADPTTLTIAGTTIGTPSYMAPEQIKGERVSAATDIYALGVVAYQLVTGETPFQGKTPLQVAARHVSEAPPAPRLLRADLPTPVETAILKALAKSPADRFTTAGAFAEALAKGLRGKRGPRTPSERSGSRLAQPLRRLRALLTPDDSQPAESP